MPPSEAYTLSEFENQSLLNTSGSDIKFNEPRCPCHILPCEQNGISMLDLAHAMQRDAASQGKVLELLCKRLEEIVQINDQRQVLYPL